MLSLGELEISVEETLNIDDVAAFLGLDAQCIRSQAQTEPAKLGFPVIVVGRRVVVPRRGFLYFMKYGYGHERSAV